MPPNMTLWDAQVFRELTDAFAFHLIGFIVIILALGFFIYKKYSFSKSVLYTIAVFYGMLFLEFMIFPTFGRREIMFQFIPFHTIREVFIPSWSQDIEIFRFVMGLLALIPLGFLLPFFCKKLKSWQSALIFSFLVPLAIEVIQAIVALIFGGIRVFDVDDILLGMVGFLVGFLFYRVFAMLFPKLTKNLQK